MRISIIIPVLNEEKRIAPLVKALINIKSVNDEIIVVDGGSTDSTVRKAKELEALSVNVMSAEAGRAFQMNAGAAASRGDVLWFVHADSVIAPSSLDDIRRAVMDGAAGGFFRLHFYDAPETDRFLKFIERTSHTRAKDYCLIFGDQGLFLRRDVFNMLGGFALLELMEDWEISRRLRSLHRQGLIYALDTVIGTSARRYIKKGRLNTWLKMNFVKALYIIGVPAKILRKFYG